MIQYEQLYLLKVSIPKTTTNGHHLLLLLRLLLIMLFKTPEHSDSSELQKPWCQCLWRGEAAGLLRISKRAQICPLLCQLINTKSFLMSTVPMATPLKSNAGRSTRALKIGHGGTRSALTEYSHGIVKGSHCAIFCAAPCLFAFLWVWADYRWLHWRRDCLL